jgi:hypothetical protein
VCGRAPRASQERARGRRRAPAQRGQALLETALVLPMLLLLAFGVVGVGRVVQAQMRVSAVAREAARVAALAGTPAEASARGTAQGPEVARGYGLTHGSLEVTVEPGELARGGQVRGAARYDVGLDDLPLLGWARVSVRSEHVERVDVYRSRWSGGQR